jgi:hypothetical protein
MANHVQKVAGYSNNNNYMNQFLNKLKELTTVKDRHIKGHSIALLKRLQELNPLDEE